MGPDDEPCCCLLKLPCSVLQHLLSFCDARTLGSLDSCATTLHRAPLGSALSPIETAVHDAAARYGPQRSRLLRARESVPYRLRLLEEAVDAAAAMARLPSSSPFTSAATSPLDVVPGA